MKFLVHTLLPFFFFALPPLASAYDGKLPNEVQAKGQYSVPVSVDLAPFATYPQNDIWYGQDGDKVTLGYMLPVELTGEKAEIELTGVDTGHGVFKMSGSHGDADCTRDSNTHLQCKIVYRNLKTDLSAAFHAIQSSFPNPNEQVKRMMVAGIFDGEPIGIISFDHPDLSSK